MRVKMHCFKYCLGWKGKKKKKNRHISHIANLNMKSWKSKLLYYSVVYHWWPRSGVLKQILNYWLWCTFEIVLQFFSPWIWYLDSGASLFMVYLRNRPHRPVWSRSQPEPRVVCVVPGRGHVAQMDRLGSPWECRLIQPTQPRVTDRGTNQALPATGASAKHDKHISVMAA